MGKTALLVATLAAVAVAASQAILSDSQSSEAMARSTHGYEILARQAAQTGHAEALHLLQSASRPPPLRPIEGQVGAARYTASYDTVEAVPLSIRVRTEGRAGAKRHVVEALLTEVIDAPPESPEEALMRVPPYLRYAAFSNRDLSFVALPRVVGNEPGLNGDIHANGSLEMTLSLDALLGLRPIAGFGTYGRQFRALSLFGKPRDLFQPYDNPDDLPTLRRTKPVLANPFDPETVSGVRRESVQGTLRLLGAVELGTRESPRIVHVKGDLVLVDVQVKGYGTFVVDGSVVVESSLTGLLAALNPHPESRVAFYADGPIVFNGLGEVEGHFVSNASVTFSGALTLYGSVAAMGPVTFLVAPTVRFVPPSSVLTPGLPGTFPSDSLAVVSTREWEVVN